MSAHSSANRWVPFQCPQCYGLFRIRKTQIGAAGHCPTCRSLLYVSEEAPMIPEATQSLKESLGKSGGSDESTGALLDRLSVAQPMTPEEVAEREDAQENRRRYYAGGDLEGNDWEEKATEDSDSDAGPSWLLIGSGIMIFVLALAGGLFYVKNKASGTSSGIANVISDLASQTKLNEILAKDRGDIYKDEDGVDATIAEVDRYEDFDMTKVEYVARRFLDSTTVTERLKLVRDPERVRALMLKHYGGEEIEAEGFGGFDKSRVAYDGDFMTITAQTTGFQRYPIAIELFQSEGGSTYKVDWESWVGYSELTLDEMKKQRPTEPLTMRVTASHGSYYNYGFSDDQEWACFRLALRGSESLVLGYAKRGSEVADKFTELLKGSSREPFVVKVAYPPDARSSDQVIILEIVTSGWIFNPDEIKDDE